MQTGSQPRYLTIGKFARLASVSPRTAAKWFDAGLLRGHRLLPNGERRITVDEARRFLTEAGIPFDLQFEERKEQPLPIPGSKLVLTVGQLARMVNVSQATVKRWIKMGELPAYRLPPGKAMRCHGEGDYRISYNEALKFLHRYGIPDGIHHHLRVDGWSILLIASTADFTAGFRQSLESHRLLIDHVSDTFTAGRQSQAYPYGIVVVDSIIGRSESFSLAHHLRHGRTRLIYLAGEDQADFAHLVQVGYQDVLRKPLSSGTVANRCLELLRTRGTGRPVAEQRGVAE